MGKILLLIVICLTLLGASYLGGRFVAGKVVGDNPKDLGEMTSRFEFSGVAGLPDHPRAWVYAYPRAKDLGPKGAEIWVSLTGKLLGTRPADLEEQMTARRQREP